MKIFSENIVVPASAIDENGHVNNIIYLQWCINVAEKHWFAKAPKTYQKSHFWVVLEHTISYKKPAFEGEELLVETWVTLAEGVKSERNYKITRISDGKVLINATTIWCFVELGTQKPARITEEIRTLFM